MYKEKNLPVAANFIKERKPSESEHNSLSTQFSVVRLTLTDFRCYDRLRLDLTDLPVILAGPNGSGKTNILEALSMLAPGRGLRNVKPSDLSRNNGSGGWAVAADLVTPNGQINIGTGYSLPSAGNITERRVVKVNGVVKSKQTSLSEHISVVWLTPQMDRLFTESVLVRRSFFDRLVSVWDSSHASRINAYKTAMRERLLLLRSESYLDTDWVLALEGTMAERGVAIAAARVEYLSRLAPVAENGVALFPGADVKLTGDLESWLDNQPAVQVEDRYRAVLKANRFQDHTRGQTRCGPHRTDMLVCHKTKAQAANLCSTGEQKALLISIILAHAKLQSDMTGVVPLLLFDEIGAHLDEERREILFFHLAKLGVQTWFTGTDKKLFHNFSDRAQTFLVNDGLITNI